MDRSAAAGVPGELGGGLMPVRGRELDRAHMLCV